MVSSPSDVVPYTCCSPGLEGPHLLKRHRAVTGVVSQRKDIVKKWFDSLGRLDQSALLSCLAEDAERTEWADGFSESGVPQQGQATIIKNIDRPSDVAVSFEVMRLTEEGNVVVAEGTARVVPKRSSPITLRFCDVFEFEHGKVRRLNSFTAKAKD